MLKQLAIKSTPCFLLLVAFIPMLFVCVFHMQQQIIRNEMKEKLEQQSLHTIALTSKDFLWMDEGKEIMIDGNMFDVHSYTQKKGTYFFIGLFDKEETILVQQLEKTTDHTGENKMLSRFFQFLQSCFYTAQHNDIYIQQSSKQQTLTDQLFISSAFTSIPTPPPRPC